MFCSNTVKANSINSEDIVKIMDKARDKFDIPAIAVVTFNSQDFQSKKITGVRRVDSDDQALLEDYFHIGSSAKSILAVLAGKLVEDGKITWETKFFDVLPELKDYAREEYYDITLDTLFSCRSGIQPFTSYQELEALDEQQRSTKLEFVKYLIGQPPASDQTDGKFEYLYSNPSYTMVAMMLERVTDSSWEEIIQDGLEKKLGLSVMFGWPNAQSAEQPWGHTKVTDEPYSGWLEVNEEQEFPADNKKLYAFSPTNEFKLPDLIAPAGDLSMKPLDYARLAQLHLQGLRGQSNYILSNTYETIHYKYPVFSYGVGSMESMGEKISAYSGSAGTFYAHTMLFPDSDFGYVILINSGSKKAVEGIHWMSSKITKKYFNLWWMFWM